MSPLNMDETSLKPFEKMTELKTSEDLKKNINVGGIYSVNYYISPNKLKKEIINWIKALQKAKDDSEKAYDKFPGSCSGDVMIGGCEFSWAYPDFEDFSSAIKILKHVHNITEEDLQ